jgi:hypothetical protein
MSGTLAQHRPGSRPLFIGGQAVYKVPAGPMDWHATRRTLKPGGLYENGRCIEYTVQLELRQRHVLDYSPEYHRPSKHARGRIRPRTAKERRRVAALMRRATQARKTFAIDIQRMTELNLVDLA